ncbi:DUF6270 domain-containing protein [Aestuariimicrobium soli]|uniref:DUF6270 domain-containing protein n=1 Tax=Aestuariimicrobium soli TaxID=2035834 RepID=UPI003EB7C15C
MTRLLIYGSCVSRDAFQPEQADEFQIVDYVARQSLISAFLGDSRLPDLDLSKLASPFQRRMVAGDLTGSLRYVLRKRHGSFDVLVCDLVDERLGVVRTADGGFATRSMELHASEAQAELLDRGELFDFGSDAHFELFAQAAVKFRDYLNTLGLLERTVIVQTPWASLPEIEGTVSPTDEDRLAERARSWNDLSARYYAALTDAGLEVCAIPETAMRFTPDHQWGLAPFHYSEDVYRRIRAIVRSAAAATD